MPDKHLKVKVSCNAGKSQILETRSDGLIKIALKSLPEKGRANQELIKFLAREFKTSQDNIKIVSGKASSLKILKIKN